MNETKTITSLDSEGLRKAYGGSYYFIAGAGGGLSEWVTGYEDMLSQREIGTPVEWFSTTGASVNAYASKAGEIAERDLFPNDLTCLLFPLDGLHVGKLAIFKLRMEDRWFDDVVQNMRTR